MMPVSSPLSLEKRIDAARSALLQTIVDPSGWDAALDALADACGARSGQIIARNDKGEIVLHKLTETPENFMRDIEAFGLADPASNPRMRAGLSLPVMKLKADQDYVPFETRAHIPIYAEMFDRFDFAHNCQIVLMRTPDLLVRASVTRTHRQGAFDADALKAFARLAPYLQAAVKTRTALGLAQVEASLRTLDAVQAAAFILSRNGRVLGVSARAANLTEEGHSGLHILQGRLRPNDHAARETFEARLARLLDGQDDFFSIVLTQTVLDVQRLAGENDSLGAGPAALAILREPRNPAERSAMLRARYGLTQAEAEIATLIAQGHSVQEIADHRHVSLPTVRSQLQSVYSKLGVSRQAELAARLQSF